MKEIGKLTGAEAEKAMEELVEAERNDPQRLTKELNWAVGELHRRLCEEG